MADDVTQGCEGTKGPRVEARGCRRERQRGSTESSSLLQVVGTITGPIVPDPPSGTTSHSTTAPARFLICLHQHGIDLSGLGDGQRMSGRVGLPVRRLRGRSPVPERTSPARRPDGAGGGGGGGSNRGLHYMPCWDRSRRGSAKFDNHAGVLRRRRAGEMDKTVLHGYGRDEGQASSVPVCPRPSARARARETLAGASPLDFSRGASQSFLGRPGVVGAELAGREPDLGWWSTRSANWIPGSRERVHRANRGVRLRSRCRIEGGGRPEAQERGDQPWPAGSHGARCTFRAARAGAVFDLESTCISAASISCGESRIEPRPWRAYVRST